MLTTDTFRLDLLSVNNYYPFGMREPERNWTKPGTSTYRYMYNGMEHDDEIKGVGNSYDYVARFYDPRLGRWLSRDPQEDKYPALTPYNYAGNTPIQAKDPDGEVIIFINGFYKDGSGGKSKYWGGYDTRVSTAIGDKSLRYVDGALGGASNTKTAAGTGFSQGFMTSLGNLPAAILNTILKVVNESNVSLQVRIDAGKLQGKKDAKSIIENLSDGETIKVVSHSMGTAYARGYIEGMVEYAKATNQLDKLKFEYELDINAFQGKSLSKSPYMKRNDNKTGGKDGGGISNWKEMGILNSVPYVAPIPGTNNTTSTEDLEKGHAVSEMSITKIPFLGNSGQDKKVEEGNKNENAPNK